MMATKRWPVDCGQDPLRECIEIVRFRDACDRNGGGTRAESARGLPQDQAAPGLPLPFLLRRRADLAVTGH
jgi:hypothetical protein